MVILESPLSISPNPPEILPLSNIPTDVNEDATILFPKVVSERTLILLILNSSPVERLIPVLSIVVIVVPSS